MLHQVVMVPTTRSKEGSVIFNDALNTFYSHIYGIRPQRERKPAAVTRATRSD